MNERITKHIPGTLPPAFLRTVEHPRFNSVLDEILRLVENPGPTRLLFVPGPTGVGKTTLASAITQRITDLYGHELKTDPNRMLYGFSSVKAPGPHAFSWKDTYSQLLESLSYPFLDKRSTYYEPPKRGPQMELPQIDLPHATMRVSTDRLFRVLQHVISMRQPKLMLLDEAHHFARVKTVESLRQQLEHLKYLADETRVLFVLFSTYELVNLTNTSGQLARRSDTVPFHRYIYRPDKSGGHASIEGFAQALLVYQEILETDRDYDFMDNVAYFYQGTIGCVGLLRDWLGRAWALAKRSNRKITKQILDQRLLPLRIRSAMLDEALEGERIYEADDCRPEELWDRLNLTQNASVPAAVEIVEPKKKGRSRLLPGHRAPHADPIGTAHILGKKRNHVESSAA